MSNEAVNEQSQPTQQSQAIPPPSTYNPFIDVVNEKPYAQMNVGVSPNQMTGSIPEPTFQANTIRANENPYSMLNDDFGAGLGAAQKPGANPINPSMNNIPDGEAKMGAEHLAKLIIDGYEQLHTFANKWLQIPERKLRKMVAEGDIDLNVEIPYEYGKTINAGQFIQEFNEQNKDTLVVTKEWKKETTPVLTRVIQKKGAGLTDEQYLGYLFAKDILVKGVIVAQVRGVATDMLNVIKEYTLAIKESGVMPQPGASGASSAPPPPPPPTPTPKPTPTYTPTSPGSEYLEEDFNFQNNEAVVDSRVKANKERNISRERAIAARKRDREMQEAVDRANGGNPSYAEAMQQRKSSGGKRGRKPKDYIVPLDEEQIAEAIILNETKEKDKNKIEGLD